MNLRRALRVALSIAFWTLTMAAQSIYQLRPADPLAVYLTTGPKGAFKVHADGVHDDSEALQQAINHVQETTHHGVVFIPEGRYRLNRTIHVWAGIRLIGFGNNRPVFVLADRSPEFERGPDRYLLWFTDERAAPGTPIADASEFTFYSAASNIDIDLGEGNPAAVAVRFNVAQHSFLSHMNIHVGSARAAVEAAGNQASDLHVEGGEYGIVTAKTSAAWQFLLMDSSFTGQRKAAIRTQDAGMTLIRDSFARTPIAIEIPQGQVEQLYGRDLRMENISQVAVKLGDVNNLRSEVTLQNIACSGVPTFLEGASSVPGGEDIRPAGPIYIEEHLTVGLGIGSDGREQSVTMRHRERDMKSMPPRVRTDIPVLPPMRNWVDVHSLGAKGDGATDDTAALQRAIDTHAVLFLPSGMYRLTGSLRLRQDTKIIGFSVFTTQLILLDSSPEFHGSGPAMPLLLTPKGGTNIVTGIGIATGNDNPRAAGIEWLAGSKSMLDDVSFVRGRSEYNALLEPAAPKPQLAAQRLPMQLDAQHASLWVHDGGGGIFRGIWSHAGTAHAGLLVENTSTPSSIYQFSCEHHMQRELRLDHAANWSIYAFQTEEEKPEGADAVPVELASSHDILFADLYMYRVSRNVLPKPYAVVAQDSDDIQFANVKVFSQTRLAFDNSFFDQGKEVAVRAHDFTSFRVDRNLHKPAPLPVPAVFAPAAALTRLDTGFSNASGLTSDSTGRIFFTDAAMHTIYRWDGSQTRAKLLAKVDGSPMVLGFAGNSTLLTINYEKSVASIQTDTGDSIPVTEKNTPIPGTVLLLPVGIHNDLWTLPAMLQHVGYVFRVGSNTALRSALLPEHRGYFYAPATSTAVMAGGTWRPLLQSSQLALFAIGDRRYLVSEDEARTYTAELREKENLVILPFAERGGTSVVSDKSGNVYIAGSQVYVYNQAGKQVGTLEVPERPSSLAFGGPSRNILFIGARGSLYSIKTVAPGE